jgi:small-conductance mechanosensitive channel
MEYLVPFLIVLATVVVLRVVHRLMARRQRLLRDEPQFRGQLILIALTLLGAMATLVTLPVTEATRGQLLNFLGVLLGAVLALSSTTVVANALAGLMLRSMRTYRPGDFVRVGEAFGRVTQRGLFTTEIQTELRDLTTLPNQYLLSNPVTVVRQSGTIVTAELSLGYDLPRQRIEELLVQAALEAELSEPFVQILELGDFSVTYRVAGFLEEVTKLVSTRSRLRGKVLDVLHGAGIEIVSPTFMNQRPLKEGQRFIPPAPPPGEAAAAEAATGESGEPTPEEIVFDKAEVASRLEQLAALHEQLESELKELEGDKASEERREAKRAQIERLERGVEALRARSQD